MTGFAIKGWCPSALRPMPSGDGLVVRLRPRGGRLSSAQAAGVAELAARHGNGRLDLTGRANLQIRGVSEASHAPLIEGLDRLGLVDADLQSDNQRNTLVAPFWIPGDDTPSLAAELEQALVAHTLGLPEKFGLAVDCGAERVLAQAPADIRIERGADGALIVREDGAPLGRAVTRAQAIDADTNITPEQKKQLAAKASVLALAQSRRVDVTLSTTGQTSTRQFPFNAEDALNLINPKGTGTAKAKPGAKAPATKKKAPTKKQ